MVWNQMFWCLFKIWNSLLTSGYICILIVFCVSQIEVMQLVMLCTSSISLISFFWCILGVPLFKICSNCYLHHQQLHNQYWHHGYNFILIIITYNFLLYSYNCILLVTYLIYSEYLLVFCEITLEVTCCILLSYN